MSDETRYGLPPAHGLYRPEFEHDSCGVGFVAHIKGERSHQILLDADHLLCRMDHRGARGAEQNTGDGAGILTALPHEFLAKVAKRELGVELPPAGKLAAGNVFLPTDAAERERCKAAVARICAEEGQTLLGWRVVPTRPKEADLGDGARAAMPQIEQLLIAAGADTEGAAFERKLYLIRKRASHELRGDKTLRQAKKFYICSLSTTTLIYKGMLTPGQLKNFYPDLDDPDYKTHLAMVHSRFSTNTFPSWDRAQPLRFMSHNGEINTVRGNENWMRARAGRREERALRRRAQEVVPDRRARLLATRACSTTCSSSSFMTGRTLQESVMMMIPEAWQKNELMPEGKRAFYEFHSCLMEPWDGPASITFTDGKCIGAVLDSNGLRPSRYYLTKDDRVIMASEVGVVPINPANVKAKGRLEPGRMFLIDFERGRLVPDEEIKNEFASRRPYAKWLDSNRIALRDVMAQRGEEKEEKIDRDTLLPRMQAFGYTTETLQFMLQPMVKEQRDPVGSMGNDSMLAVLSDKPRMLYDYFRQLFAQVTNPPIDSIREEVIMSLECYVGPEANLLETTPKHAERLRLRQPILSNEELAGLKKLNHRGWKSRTIDITFARGDVAGRAQGRDRSNLPRSGASDRRRMQLSRAVGQGHRPGPRAGELAARVRRRASPSREPREAHADRHRARDGRGARGAPPLPARRLRRRRHQPVSRVRGAVPVARGRTAAGADTDVVGAYRKAVAKGMLKVMAKMGISTLQSYKGAQIFEALGIADEVIERCFAGTASRLKA